MRKLLPLLVLFGFLSATQAAQLCVTAGAETCATLPDPILPELSDTCEDLRVNLRVLTANWSYAHCALELVRRGGKLAYAQKQKKGAVDTIQAAVTAAINTYDTDFPIQASQSACGDNAIDAEFGEQCDDGNLEDGDGCSSACQTE